MKLSAVILAAAATLSAVHAQGAPGTVAPSSPATTPAANATTPAANSTTPAANANTTTTSAPDAAAGANSPLDTLKQKAYGKEYHMPYVRVVQARVQSDKPDLIKGRFVSKFGNGDLAKGYQSGMDSVNMASVEGALMYVQAEGINQNSRAAINRCKRKNDMTWVVLYEILIAQTNETIAQFSEGWNIPEYGPMIPMDGGRCTPLTGETFPAECYMMNGVKDYPNIGPFIGAGYKSDDVRAPYPETIWFSFAHTCPLKVWGEKADANNACRAESRKGLCDIGQAPDGVTCTYAYDILGWVPIDDVVGITSIKDDRGNNYSNFTTWCEASDQHIEFAGDDRTGEMANGLEFWSDPLDPQKNAERASKVIELYQDIKSGDFKSSMISDEDLKSFKDLPDPAALAEKNPPCYKTTPGCNSGNGCKRAGFSQVCKTCTSPAPECKTDASFTFPTLEKAQTTKPADELTSGSKLGGANGATGGVNSTLPSSNPTTTKAPVAGQSAAVGLVLSSSVATVAASVVAMLAL